MHLEESNLIDHDRKAVKSSKMSKISCSYTKSLISGLQNTTMIASLNQFKPLIAQG